MEPAKGDPPKLPDMVVFRSMCGDHPSITKTELNIKELKDDRLDEKHPDKEKKERLAISYGRISPSSSRTERAERAVSEQKSQVMSEHAMRVLEARRHAAAAAVRSADVLSRHDDINAPANRALVQAALGSFRWPPYLVAVWVVVLVLTHVLHCLVTMLERALPSLKKLCTYFRAWAESSWRGETEVNHRVIPLGLGAVTALLYAGYVGLYAVYAVALWALEPLCSEDSREDETKVTDYVVDEFPTNHNNSNLNNK